MPLALVLSSYVAAGYVGGEAARAAFFARGIDCVLVPSVVLGRHPGWGPPGGGATPVDRFASMIEAVAANGLLDLADIVVTGYFAEPAQIDIAAAMIDRLSARRRREEGPRPLIVVDPIIGDVGKGLYVSEVVAAAQSEHLIPRADLVCPNAWELGFLCGATAVDGASLCRAAKAWGAEIFCTSLPHPKGAGLAWSDGERLLSAGHPLYPQAPHGLGDLATAAFAAGCWEKRDRADNLARTGGLLHALAKAANDWAAPEQPLAACRDLLRDPPLLPVATLHNRDGR